MKLLVFAKKRTSKDGKAFFTYLSTLTRKDGGEVITVQVKFREACGAPDPHKCPRYITVPRDCANYHEKTIEDEDITKIARTLWVSEWDDAGDYIDTSLDEFADD